LLLVLIENSGRRSKFQEHLAEDLSGPRQRATGAIGVFRITSHGN
jgi:hypothetical protein